MIKVVLFDGNGVIYDRVKDYDKPFFDKLSEESDFNDVKTVFNLLKYDCKMGLFSRVELFQKVLRIIGLNADPVKLDKDYSKVRLNTVLLLKRILPVLETLKSKDIKIGLLSDGIFSPEEKGKWLKKLGVKKYFNYIFTSQSLGFTKIYPQCLIEAIKRIGCKPNKVLLIGHELNDFLGAMFLGVPTLSVGYNITTTYNVKDFKSIPEFLVNEGLIK